MQKNLNESARVWNSGVTMIEILIRRRHDIQYPKESASWILTQATMLDVTFPPLTNQQYVDRDVVLVDTHYMDWAQFFFSPRVIEKRKNKPG